MDDFLQIQHCLRKQSPCRNASPLMVICQSFIAMLPFSIDDDVPLSSTSQAPSSGSTPPGTPPVSPPSVEHSTPPASPLSVEHSAPHNTPPPSPASVESVPSPPHDPIYLAPKKQGGRSFEKYCKSYFCPVKGCGSGKPQKKLSNHLIAVHGISLAKVDGPAKPGAIKVDVRLESCLKKLQTIASPNYLIPTCAIKTGKTNHYPR